MIKHYQIMAPLDTCDYDKSEDVFDSSLPYWIKKEMRKVSRIEGVNIRDLSFKREIFWDNNNHRWVDSAEITKH